MINQIKPPGASFTEFPTAGLFGCLTSGTNLSPQLNVAGGDAHPMIHIYLPRHDVVEEMDERETRMAADFVLANICNFCFFIS